MVVERKLGTENDPDIIESGSSIEIIPEQSRQEALEEALSIVVSGDDVMLDNEMAEEELVEEDGELFNGEGCGHIHLEVWGNYFTLNISTAFGDVLELSDMPIRMLKKLNKFLSYAIDSQATLNDPPHRRR